MMTHIKICACGTPIIRNTKVDCQQRWGKRRSCGKKCDGRLRSLAAVQARKEKKLNAAEV